MAKSYKGIIIGGSTFPGSPYRITPVTLNETMRKEYLPAIDRALPVAPRGLKLLITAICHQEGFAKGTRSYRTNNPGNIGNVDSGTNRVIATLEDGIKLQADYITAVAEGKKAAYDLNKPMLISPYYSKEIAANPAAYGMDPNLPGYSFIYTGQIDQFVKIYSTAARASNSYLNTIVSYFKINGLQITPESKLADIIKMN